MTKVQQYYKLLDLEYPSTRDEIKKAFHRLAHIHHPDKGGDEAKFKKISEAYSFLIQHGYWDMLAKEKRIEQKTQSKARSKYDDIPNVFVSDDGKTFWTEDWNGNVSTMWTAGQSIYDATAWQILDDSSPAKGYADLYYNEDQLKRNSEHLRL